MVTIFCVSTPALRPLYRRYIDDYSDSNPSKIGQGSFPLNHFSGIDGNDAACGHGFTAGVTHTGHPANRSDESILGSDYRENSDNGGRSGARDGGGITLTRSVVLEYETAPVEVDKSIEEA